MIETTPVDDKNKPPKSAQKKKSRHGPRAELTERIELGKKRQALEIDQREKDGNEVEGHELMIPITAEAIVRLLAPGQEKIRSTTRVVARRVRLVGVVDHREEEAGHQDLQ